jgi:hypothetical protein
MGIYREELDWALEEIRRSGLNGIQQIIETTQVALAKGELTRKRRTSYIVEVIAWQRALDMSIPV